MSGRYNIAKSDTKIKTTALKSAESAVKALKGKDFVSLFTGKVKRGQPIPPPRYSTNRLAPIVPGYGPFAPNREIATAKAAEKITTAAKAGTKAVTGGGALAK